MANCLRLSRLLVVALISAVLLFSGRVAIARKGGSHGRSAVSHQNNTAALHDKLLRIETPPLLNNKNILALQGEKRAIALREANTIASLASGTSVWNSAYDRAQIRKWRSRHAAEYSRILQSGTLLQKALWRCPGAMAQLKHTISFGLPIRYRSGMYGSRIATAKSLAASQHAIDNAELQLGVVWFLSPEFKQIQAINDAKYRRIATSGTLLQKAQWNVPGAIQLLQSLANKNDAQAQEWLARITHSEYWYHRAALGNNAQAQYHLGKIDWQSADRFSAMRWFKKAAVQGYLPAEVRVGQNYGLGYTRPREMRLAAYWLGRAANQGSVSACMDMARDLRFYSPHPDQELYWTRRAAMHWPQSKHLLAAGKLSTVYWINDAIAQLMFDYYKGRSVPRNYAKVLQWGSRYVLRAVYDPINEEYVYRYLGDLYYFGRGVRQNYHLAARYFARALAGGYSMSMQMRLGRMFWIGQGVPKHPILGAALFTLPTFNNYAMQRMRATPTFYKIDSYIKLHKSAREKIRKLHKQLEQYQDGNQKRFAAILNPYF